MWEEDCSFICSMELMNNAFEHEKGLGPVHRSIRPVEILTRVQFYLVFIYVSKSHRVQCFYALDPNLSL